MKNTIKRLLIYVLSYIFISYSAIIAYHTTNKIVLLIGIVFGGLALMVGLNIIFPRKGIKKGKKK